MLAAHARCLIALACPLPACCQLHAALSEAPWSVRRAKGRCPPPARTGSFAPVIKAASVAGRDRLPRPRSSPAPACTEAACFASLCNPGSRKAPTARCLHQRPPDAAHGCLCGGSAAAPCARQPPAAGAAGSCITNGRITAAGRCVLVCAGGGLAHAADTGASGQQEARPRCGTCRRRHRRIPRREPAPLWHSI